MDNLKNLSNFLDKLVSVFPDKTFCIKKEGTGFMLELVCSSIVASEIESMLREKIDLKENKVYIQEDIGYMENCLCTFGIAFHDNEKSDDDFVHMQVNFFKDDKVEFFMCDSGPGYYNAEDLKYSYPMLHDGKGVSSDLIGMLVEYRDALKTHPISKDYLDELSS